MGALGLRLPHDLRPPAHCRARPPSSPAAGEGRCGAVFTRNSKLAEKNTAPNKEACPPRPAPPPARYWGSYGEKNHRRRRSWKGQYQLRCWRTPSRVTSTAGGGVSPAACAGVRGGRRPGRYIPRFKPSTSSNCPEGRHKATLSRG